jgi:hypothetical protein
MNVAKGFEDVADENEQKQFRESLEYATHLVDECMKDGLDLKQTLIMAIAVMKVGFLDTAAHVNEMEQLAFEYAGTWKSDTQYRPNQFVTHRGSMWHSQIYSKGVTPGDGQMWKLAVKQGRDREKHW